MTQPDSDGERPGWRIHRAKPSPTGPLIVLVVLAAVIFGVGGYVLGSSGKDEPPQQAVAPVATAPAAATPLAITAPPTPTPALLAPTQTPLPNPSPAAALTVAASPRVPATSPTVTPAASVTITPSATQRPVTPAPRTVTAQSGEGPLAIAARLNVPDDQRQKWVEEFLSMNNTTATTMPTDKPLLIPSWTP